MSAALKEATLSANGQMVAIDKLANKASGATRFFKNLGSSLLNMAAMALTTTALDHFVKYVAQYGDRLDEKTDAQRTAWQQTKEEVQSLNDELLANKERIAEINELKAAGNISTQAAATELKTLQETNAALQTQIDLKTMIAEGQKRAAEITPQLIWARE